MCTLPRLRRSGAPAAPTKCRYFGADFLIQLDDLIGYEIAINRLEWREIKLMIDACERLKPDIFVDVGANVGLYSCILGRRHLVPQVLALEPDKLNFSRLGANLALNGLAAIVEARAIAAGARSATMAFAPAGPENRGVSKLGPVEAGGYDVIVAPLDDLLHIEDRKIVVKIDVEGYELEVLEGAERLFRRNKGFAQIEGHGDRRAAEITARMTTLGWQFVDRYGIDLRFERSSVLLDSGHHSS